MNVKYLTSLADIVVNIDERKNITDANIVDLTDYAIRLIVEMQSKGSDVGALREIFIGMQLMCANRVVLPELIDMAHEEITKLLGEDGWRVYGYEDGWLFCGADGVPGRAVA